MYLKKSLLIFTILFSSIFAEEQISSHEFYGEIAECYQSEDWDDVIDFGEDFIEQYPESPFTADINYFLGVAYFKCKDYEFANDYFSKYLGQNRVPKHFEKAMHYKFYIAEKFRQGAKKRIFKWQRAHVYLSTYEDAMDIYDEVIHSYPYQELGAKSLYGKGVIQMHLDDFKDSVETFQLLTQRFPKDELAIEAYLKIAEIYYTECENEKLDPDLLNRARNNLRKFKRAFPSSPRLEDAEGFLEDMRSAFADNLFDTAEFYERTGKPKAAKIYYQKVISEFPETEVADYAEYRLNKLHV